MTKELFYVSPVRPNIDFGAAKLKQHHDGDALIQPIMELKLFVQGKVCPKSRLSQLHESEVTGPR